MTCGQLNNEDNTNSRCALLADSTRAAHAYLAEQTQVRVASADFSVLVSLIGFMRFQVQPSSGDDGPHGEAGGLLLPLRLRDVTYKEHADTSELQLTTECARLKFYLARDSRQLLVGSIEVQLDVTPPRVTSQLNQRECQIQSTAIKLNDFQHFRYLCETPVRYDCTANLWQGNDTFKLQTIGQLDLRLLEFELAGDARVLRTNKFSKKLGAQPCS